MWMMLAQSILEYVSLSSISTAVSSAAYTVGERLSNVSQSTWVIIGLVALVVLLGIDRRRTRRL